MITLTGVSSETRVLMGVRGITLTWCMPSESIMDSMEYRQLDMPLGVVQCSQSAALVLTVTLLGVMLLRYSRISIFCCLVS